MGYGLGMSADTKGIVSKGLIRGMVDVKADNLILGVKGVRSNADVVADNNLVAKKAKFFSNVDVNAHATFGSATIKGKLYVGKRAIGDVVNSMEKEMAAMRAEVAETKENLRQMLAMMKK